MTAPSLLNEIDAHLRLAPTVVYLEGRSDVAPFFALLGVPTPRDGIHANVYVHGLTDEGRKGRAPGAGTQAVRARVSLASENNRARVLGTLDGDGRPLAELAPEFDPPHLGPLFSWKSYCIENELAKTAWVQEWGGVPDWRAVLEGYAPYVALNRIGAEIRADLQTLRLANFINPDPARPLLSEPEVRATLANDKHRVANLDVEARFAAEVASYRTLVTASLEQGHALLNGKWLMRHYAPSVSKLGADACIEHWCAAVRKAGGSPQVRDLWTRIVRAAP